MNKEYGLIGLAVSVIILSLLLPPIPQDLAYHHFADQRTWLGIRNAGDVLSNSVFLLVGILGLALLQCGPSLDMPPSLHRQYSIFFAGVLLTGLGSAYYHSAPDNPHLFWDRLPMTIAFMSFFCSVVHEAVDARMGERLLWPLLSLGAGSTIYWQWSESMGHGDLRFYGLVQFLPMLLLPLILLLYPTDRTYRRHVIGLMLCYLLAKIAELLDHQIYQLLGFISGHSLKHLLAGGGTYCIYALLKQRRSLQND